jgi:hypothetical protein
MVELKFEFGRFAFEKTNTTIEMASPTSTQYETLYGVNLLDDLHNYFPAVLYDSSRFRSVQDLLHYIQTSARNRFDLFSFGQRAYLNSHLPPETTPPEAPATPQRSTDLSGAEVPVPPGAPARRRRPAGPAPASFQSSLEVFLDAIDNDLGTQPPATYHSVFQYDNLGLNSSASSLLNLVNMLGGYSAVPGTRIIRTQNPLFDDVEVFPTPEQVEAGTTRIFPPGETPCSICQDSIAINQMARQINFCKHMFHISCIDEWFARNVHCPVCRHDIRDVNAEHQQADTSHP